MLPRLRCCLVAEGRQEVESESEGVFGCLTATSILPLGLHASARKRSPREDG
jgi:hypothetical protein